MRRAERVTDQTVPLAARVQLSKAPRRPRVPSLLSSGPRRQRVQTPPSRSALPVRRPVKNSNLTVTRRAMRKWPRPRCCHHFGGWTVLARGAEGARGGSSGTPAPRPAAWTPARAARRALTWFDRFGRWLGHGATRSCQALPREPHTPTATGRQACAGRGRSGPARSRCGTLVPASSADRPAFPPGSGRASPAAGWLR